MSLWNGGKMNLRGNRLIINGLEREDLRERHKWLNDPEITRYFTNLGSTSLSEADLLNWYESILTKKSQELHFAIFTGDLKHIGGAQLKSIDWKNRNAELGIFIGDKSEWGKGYGTEATGILIHYGFNELNLHRLWLRVDTENLAALKSYQKSGMIQEGIFRDEVFREGAYHHSMIMSILRNEFCK
jgi:RimJ/RimL family protein N-acetyltransferase